MVSVDSFPQLDDGDDIILGGRGRIGLSPTQPNATQLN